MKKIFTVAMLSLIAFVAPKAEDFYTVAQIMDIYNNLNLENAGTSEGQYTVRGYVTKWKNGYPSYQNADFFIDDSASGSTSLFECFRLTGQQSTDQHELNVGDYIEATGYLKKYNDQAELVNGTFRVISESSWTPIPVSISQIISDNDGKRYILTGVVTSIDDASYGNLYIKDNTGSIYIYNLKNGDGSAINFVSLNLEEGDTLTLSGMYKRYNNMDEIVNPLYISHKKGTKVSVPGSLRVCAQNLENYYYNYTQSSRPKYNDEAGFRAKTVKIVNAMLNIDADIYAFCEVEAKPIVLQQLADSMNAHANAAGRYAAVNDNIDYNFGEGNDNHIKSGFIYRTDKVETVGSSTGGTPGNGYYSHTMRIQAFRLLVNSEKLVLSMNHFKAKDSSSDQGEAQRQTNANNLVNALGNITADPDILVLGDLNCEYGEDPITTIINAGYEEQILRFDSSAYSHCYDGGELIDHVLANASMKAQIDRAYVKHVCAYKCNSSISSSNSYSDHDPYVIEIVLGRTTTGIENTESKKANSEWQKVIRNGQLIIIRGAEAYTITGQRLQ
ncbi:MAG: hypothetical protein J5621_07915 [Paludibacteraceae bacterium]|nr:hypothetical protein [Paludibacteraceae bacterium]